MIFNVLFKKVFKKKRKNLTQKMYVLVRRDLAETYRCVQGCHAVSEYSLKGDLGLYGKWNNGTLVFLGVSNLSQIESWYLKIINANKIAVPFYEPDLRMQMTAIACIDDGEIFQNLKIA